MKLVASLVVRNERGRYLELCIRSLLGFCDEIRVLDDGSDDGSADLCEQLGAAVTRSPSTSFFQHEGRIRQRLLDWTLAAGPTHVLSIDADEIVSDGAAVRRLVELQPDARVWSLAMEEVWEFDSDALCIREDGGWRTHPVPVLWRAPTERLGQSWRITNRRLACGREPMAVQRLAGGAVPTGEQLLHLGWLDPSERQRRYDRYAVADGGRFHASSHLQSILWPPNRITLRPREWPPSLEPIRPLLEQKIGVAA